MGLLPKTHISKSADVLTGPLNKLWRSKILLDRTLSTMSKGSKGTTDPIPNPKIKNIEFTKKLQAENRDYIEAVGKNYQETGTSLFPSTELNPQNIHNDIIIINPNMSPPFSLIIQGKPSEVKYTPDSSWASVKSMGRNNPFLMYTGGEDSLEFDISWFSTSENRRDVIDKCRILESWSKADGYTASPPILMISWGSSNLFQDDYWVLTQAPYVLSNFQNACRLNSFTKDEGVGVRRLTEGFKDLGLYPNIATQSLVFKKVTVGNLTHKEIQKPTNELILNRNNEK